LKPWLTRVSTLTALLVITVLLIKSGSNRFWRLDLSEEILRLYWYWAAERQNIFFAKLSGKPVPYTEDPILQKYKFTNAYRASDRVSQYLIRNVIYPQDGYEYTPEDMVFRILLFKRFNKISTWQWVEENIFPVTLKGFDVDLYIQVFDQLKQQEAVYNTAYNAGRVQGPYPSKYGNHILALKQAENASLFQRILQATSLRQVADLIREIPGVGGWLAYQFSIDLNYSAHINFDENDYVLCGPGAISGINKCFRNSSTAGNYEKIVRHMVDVQGWIFDSFGLKFQNLFGRPLHLIDCQNIFCELAKYTRESHPNLNDKHKTIKFRFYPDQSKSKLEPFYPPKWGLDMSQLSL
jgi:hypothetical protein